MFLCDETNWIYVFALICVAVFVLILILFSRLRLINYIKASLFKRKVEERDIDKEWEPFLGSKGLLFIINI